MQMEDCGGMNMGLKKIESPFWGVPAMRSMVYVEVCRRATYGTYHMFRGRYTWVRIALNLRVEFCDAGSQYEFGSDRELPEKEGGGAPKLGVHVLGSLYQAL